MLFLIYINDLADGLSSNTKLFADDNFVFSIIHDSVITTSKLNKDLNRIKHLQRKISFNPDSNKQDQEVIFPSKLNTLCHPPVRFNNSNVSQGSSRKHLGLTLDNSLTIEKHLTDVSKKLSKTIGLL